MNIKDFVQIDEGLASSGQPTRAQLLEIAALGYGGIINLSVPGSKLGIPEEGQIVTQNTMNYLHIPVNWSEPSSDQYRLFEANMDVLKDGKVWVHCISNVVAAFFIYTYLLNGCQPPIKRGSNSLWIISPSKIGNLSSNGLNKAINNEFVAVNRF